MIRIPTYEEHRNKESIFNIYLYLAAWALPFNPRDVLDDDILAIGEDKVDGDNFIKISKKSPRIRNKSYKSRLSEYGIRKKAKESVERFKQDELLAARIIWKASTDLYKYLYNVEDSSSVPKTAPPIKRDNLRTLLVGKMDELSKELLNMKIDQKDILLKEVFRYDVFSKHDKVIELLKLMDVSVCPYCNRQYTFTASNEIEEDASGYSRPQLDHYNPKKDYPQFAISLLNLVPSCGLCNQGKGEKIEPVLYPYSEEMGYDIVFQTNIKKDFTYLFGNKDAVDEFDVTLEVINSELDEKFIERFKNSKKYFRLTELYNGHKDYIIYLHWKNYVFSDKYLDMLCAEFPQMFSDKDEVKSLLYMMDINKEHWGKRVLGKLTHDIDREMGD